MMPACTAESSCLRVMPFPGLAQPTALHPLGGRRGRTFVTSVDDNAADRLAGVHEVERLVDVAKRHGVGDEVVDVDLALHVPVDDPRDIGAASRAAERGALPDAPGDELEGTRADLLAGACDADDDRRAPAAVTAFERLAHQI